VVDQCGEVHHLLGNEQEKMAQLRRTMYRGLPLEQTYELVSQLRSVACHPLAGFHKEISGVGR
jgi:hypothetical protein